MYFLCLSPNSEQGTIVFLGLEQIYWGKDSPSYGIFLGSSNYFSRKYPTEVVSKDVTVLGVRRFRFYQKVKERIRVTKLLQRSE